MSDCFTVTSAAKVSAVQTIALLGLFDFTGMRSCKLKPDFVSSIYLTAHLSYSGSVAPWRSLGESWPGSPDGAGLRADAGQCNAPLVCGPGRTTKSLLVGLSIGQISILRSRSTTSYCGCIMPRTAALRRVDMEGGLVGKDAIPGRDYK